MGGRGADIWSCGWEDVKCATIGKGVKNGRGGEESGSRKRVERRDGGGARRRRGA